MLFSPCFKSVVFLTSMVSSTNTKENRALGKTARQSSTFYNPFFEFMSPFRAVASLAVDGDASDKFEDRSCMHTKHDDSPGAWSWWEVDLEQNFWIEHIKIMSRREFVGRSHDLRIDVYLERSEPRKKRHCTTYVGPPASPGWVNITCDTPVSGRYVRISKFYKGSGDVLNMCEVEIFGAEVQENPAVGEKMKTYLAIDEPKGLDQLYRNCCRICN